MGTQAITAKAQVSFCLIFIERTLEGLQ
jgi:hypothetical protein